MCIYMFLLIFVSRFNRMVLIYDIHLYMQFKVFFTFVFHVDAELGKSLYIVNNFNAIVHEWKQNNWEKRDVLD